MISYPLMAFLLPLFYGVFFKKDSLVFRSSDKGKEQKETDYRTSYEAHQPNNNHNKIHFGLQSAQLYFDTSIVVTVNPK